VGVQSVVVRESRIGLCRAHTLVSRPLVFPVGRTVNVRLAGMAPAVCAVLDWPAPAARWGRTKGGRRTRTGTGTWKAERCEYAIQPPVFSLHPVSGLQSPARKCLASAVGPAGLCWLVLAGACCVIAKPCLQSNGRAPPALWPHGGKELKKAVSSCVQRALKPANQGCRCASLDRGLHEPAGMLGA
jgi:hypothetical protein